MFVDGDELHDVQAFAERLDGLDSVEDEQIALSEFFYRRLHLLLPCGFDEIRYTPVQVTPAEGEADGGIRTANVGSVRDQASGVWYHVVYGTRPDFDGGNGHADVVLFPEPFPTNLNQMLFIPVHDIVAACRAQPDHAAAVVFPALWYPPQAQPTLHLADTTKTIVTAIRDEAMSLRDLTWRQLEEVVAELLRARGLAVDVTPRTGDGGRDIIARGELIPGEPALLAVEVKHMQVVNVGEVREALWANRRFPAVMVATSGRFAAGVIKERNDPDNRFRLLLKDGVALGQWVREYRARGA